MGYYKICHFEASGGLKIPFSCIATYSLFTKWKDYGVIRVIFDNVGYFKNPRCLEDNFRGRLGV
jgi:hypothetical protein